PNADPPRSATAASPLAHTRASAAWMALIFFAVVLVLLLIFIVQNTATVPINYLGATGHLPISVAMLLSAVGGVLLAASAGTMRIIQLRRRLRRSEHDRGRSELRSHR
ncbi:MAG TPA: lipopolysaccharide assembly protein LapA domain-containing protein, partial [Nocardioidaceae bacterium]|nr:lipopolysaccharide assembly protein LapA domain-containing protein [Nocardioidaceae bacterium]